MTSNTLDSFFQSCLNVEESWWARGLLNVAFFDLGEDDKIAEELLLLLVEVFSFSSGLDPPHDVNKKMEIVIIGKPEKNS